MDLNIFPPAELEPALRALRAITIVNDSFTEAERDFVESVAHMHGASIDAHALEPISLAEVARAVADPHRRKRLVQLAIVMALVDGEPTEFAERAVEALASALDIPEQGLRVIYDMCHGHTMLARFDMARRIRAFTQGVPDFPGFRKVAAGLLGLGGEDPDLAARYRALASCAPHT